MAAAPHNSKGCSAVNTGDGLSRFENSASANIARQNATEGRSAAHILHAPRGLSSFGKAITSGTTGNGPPDRAAASHKSGSQ